MDLEPELAEKVAEQFRAKAKFLRDLLGRIPTEEEWQNFRTDIDTHIGCYKKSSDI